MSRVLVWSPNYWPELIGIPPLVTDLAEWLAERGHAIDVVTAFPNYPERNIHTEYRRRWFSREQRNGVAIHRSWLRVRPGESIVDKALYEITFAGSSVGAAFSRARRADSVVCVVPSLLAAVAAAALFRGPRLVLWWQDLVLKAGASVRGCGPGAERLLRAARRLEVFAGRRADRVVACSPGFVSYLEAAGVSVQKVGFLPNWVDTDWIVPVERDPQNTTRFLYAGNLGYTQGFETLLEAMNQLPEGMELAVAGAGNAAVKVYEAAAVNPQIRVGGPVPRERYPALLANADVHVVLQRAISSGANLPSKIASYLSSGRPIVASIDHGTPAADLLRDSGAALLVPPEDPDALAAAMRRLHQDPALRERLGARGRAFAVGALAKKTVLPLLEAEIVGT